MLGNMPPQSTDDHNMVDDAIGATLFAESTISSCNPSASSASCASRSDPDPVSRQSTANHSRTVSFSDCVETHHILHRLDMKPEEILAAWPSRIERRQSRLAIENTIFLMKSGVGRQLVDGDHFCARGLEHLYHEGIVDGNQDEVKKSLQIALAMQRVLKRVGTSSPHMIAKAYRKYTLRSRCSALRKATSDRAYVDDENGRSHEKSR